MLTRYCYIYHRIKLLHEWTHYSVMKCEISTTSTTCIRKYQSRIVSNNLSLEAHGVVVNIKHWTQYLGVMGSIPGAGHVWNYWAYFAFHTASGHLAVIGTWCTDPWLDQQLQAAIYALTLPGGKVKSAEHCCGYIHRSFSFTIYLLCK